MSNPKEAFAKLMDQYGMTPSDILGTEEEGSESNDSAAMREIRDLKSRLEAAEKRAQERESAVVSRSLEEFASTHEFFDDVTQEMTDLAWSYRARKEPVPPLEELYEKACWANKDIREKLISRDRKKSVDSKDPEKLDKAKRAAKTRVKPTQKTSSAKAKTQKSLRDELSENFDKMQAR
jgi:hypothetical protein